MPELRFPTADGQSSHLAYRLSRSPGPRGDRDCVLWCHGFASSQQSRKVEFFGRRFNAAGWSFCSFDFQGHGASGGTMAQLSLSRNLDDLHRMVEWLRSEGFERLVLFGSSMGAGVAIWYAGRRPERVAAAVYIAPGLNLERGVGRRLGAEGFARWQREKRIVLEHELGAFELDWQLIEDLRSYDRGDLPAAYRTPTLIFQGTKDLDVDWRMVVDFASQCAAETVQVHLMTDGGHRLLERLPLMWRVTAAFMTERELFAGSDAVEEVEHG